MIDFDQFWRFHFDGISWQHLVLIPVNYVVDGLPKAYGTYPTEPGFLKISADGVEFEFAGKQTNLRLEDVTYYGLLWPGNHRAQPSLVVHQIGPDQWEMAVFEITVENLHEFVHRLQHYQPNAPLAPYPDFGPASAQSMQQDLDGMWHAESMVNLYLAPGYVLASGQPVLKLDHITALTLKQEMVRPFGVYQNLLEPTTLLCIEYQPPDTPQPTTLHFRFRYADPQTWATILQARAGIDQIEHEQHRMYPAQYHSVDSTASYAKPGYLDLKDELLIFKFQDKNQPDLEIPLADVAFFGARRTDHYGLRRALTVHCPAEAAWMIYTFEMTMDHRREFREELLRIDPTAPLTSDEDYGPARVQWVQQDIYGAWHERGKIMVYLAPDRLLADGRTLLLLDQITRLALIPEMTFQMLRIDYQTPDDPQLLSIGFHFPDDVPQNWGDILQERTGIELVQEGGRKKKKRD